jgi:hypothetical protein
MSSAARTEPFQVVTVSRLDYIEAAADAIRIATSGTKIRKQQPISEIASQLDPHGFVAHSSGLCRQHRAHLEGRALREGQPGGRPPRRNSIAGEPKRISAVEGVIVEDPRCRTFQIGCAEP